MKHQNIGILILVGLMIGTLGGYYIGSLPISGLQSAIAAQSQQITSLQNSNTQLSNQVSSLLTDKQTLGSQITSLQSQISDMKKEIESMTLRINNKYNTSGVDGVYLLNYSMKYGLVGLTQTYTADITLYNSLSTAIVTVKVYGSDSREFTYTIPTGENLHRVETWSGDIWTRNYNNIVIETVKR